MLHRFVCDAKLSEVVSNHLRLDLNLVESFSLVNSDNASNHLWENNHVSKMSLHTLRLLKCGTLLLCLSQAFEQSKVLSLETSVESSSQSSSIHLDELLIAHIQELIEIYTSEGEFFEATLLSEFSCCIIRHFDVEKRLTGNTSQLISNVHHTKVGISISRSVESLVK